MLLGLCRGAVAHLTQVATSIMEHELVVDSRVLVLRLEVDKNDSFHLHAEPLALPLRWMMRSGFICHHSFTSLYDKKKKNELRNPKDKML